MADILLMTKEIEGNIIRIHISGEIDIYSAPDFKKRLYEIVEDEEKDVIIDCKELSYIDSTGLGILVGVLKRVRQYERNVTIVNTKDNIQKLFTITGLDKVFSMGGVKMFNENDRISVQLPFKAEYVGIARLCVSGIASRMGFDMDAIEDIKVAVSEVCSRIIEKRVNSMNTYQVDFIIEKEVLSIEFSLDEALQEEPFDSYTGELAQEIMSALMDVVKFSKGNSVVFMTKKVGKE